MNILVECPDCGRKLCINVSNSDCNIIRKQSKSGVEWTGDGDCIEDYRCEHCDYSLNFDIKITLNWWGLQWMT